MLLLLCLGYIYHNPIQRCLSCKSGNRITLYTADTLMRKNFDKSHINFVIFILLVYKQ